MTLEKAQEDEIRKQVVEKFGEESVKRMDLFYMELNDIRMSAQTSYDFLEKVKEKYAEANTDLLLAGLLYGMKLGELACEYQFKQAQEAKEAGELQKKEEDLQKKEEEAKKKKLEAEWEAADKRRHAEAEMFYQ